MKRFRYMLCILGLSGLFSAYQFDATAACNAAVAGQFCKMGSAYDCREGCYCLGGSRTNVGTNFIAACKNKKATLPSGAGIHYCPNGFPESQAGAKSEEDCYFWDCENVPNGTSCVGVWNRFKTLAPGKYFPVKKGTPASCTQSNIGPNDYCPGGSFKPSSAEKVGIFTCSTGTVRTSDLKNCTKTCPSGQYLKVTWQNRRWVRACTICPAGYKCPGNEPWIVAGEGDVTEDKGKIQCTGNTYASGEGNAVCTQCSSTGPNGQMLAVAVQHDADGLNVGCGPVEVSHNNGATARTDVELTCTTGRIKCSPGTYLKKNGTTVAHCLDCEKGYYCRGGCYRNTSPYNGTEQGREDCGPGKTSGPRASSVTQCTSCTGNTYAPGPHSESCQACPLTQRVKVDHSDCEDCDPGYEQDNPNNPTQCRAKTYTAYYDCNGGGEYSGTTSVVYGSPDFTPEQGTVCVAPENYSFNGWKIGSTSCSPSCEWSWAGDRTLVAQWVAGPATQYTVTFNCGNGGTGNPNPGSVTVETGGSINTPDSSACTRANHSYTQWKSGNLILPAGGSYTWLGNADDTMTPDWVQNTNCSVTYMCNGASVGTFTYTTSSFNVEEGCDALPDGRTFKWWVDSNGTHTLDGGYYSCNGASAVTLTAEYNDAQVNPGSGGGATTYTITYNCIYGTNPNPQTGIESGDHVTVLSATACEKPNYHYTRWSSSSAGYFDVDEVVSSWTHGDQTLVPDWEPDSTQNPNGTTYTITYNCLNGTSLDSETGIQNGDDVQMPSAQACVKSGYHYTQWRSNYTGVGPFDADEVVSWTYGNRTLYPDWVSDGNNGGGNGGNTTVTSCSSGQYVPLGGTSCTNCPSGSFCPTAGTAVGGKSYSCFMGIPNNDHKTCRMVLDRDNMLHGLASGDDCWLKQMVDGPDGYKHCMFEGINQVQ